MSVLIIVVSMIISAFDPSIASYSGIIVIQGYTIQSFCLGLIDHVSNTESEMSCCERLIEYQQLPDETKQFDKWVVEGGSPLREGNTGLLIENLHLRYRPELPLALKGVDVHF